MSILNKFFKSESEKLFKKLSPLADEVFSFEDSLKEISDQELKNKSLELRNKIQSEIGESDDKELEKKVLDKNLPLAFALVREAARRSLNMMHYKVQVIGGIMMHRGYIAEMRTGEGKTLVATLPAYLNALTGRGVHIVTVNDYLSKRDAV